MKIGQMAYVKKIYPVQGMSCSSCASSIQTMLGAQEGIRTANVNLAGEQVLVEYDPEKVTLERSKRPLTASGSN
jgi:Cu2+-exporting ATPase